MNPGIFYLYEYKNNQKQRNVGFLKLIRHYQTCTIQIQARGIPVNRQDTLKLSAFYVENETAHAEIVSEITCSTHAISAKLNIAESRFPNKHSLNNIHGFLLQLPSGNILAAAMPGITLNTQSIQYPEEQTDSRTSRQPENPQTTPPQPHTHLEAESLDLCMVPSLSDSTDTPASTDSITVSNASVPSSPKTEPAEEPPLLEDAMPFEKATQSEKTAPPKEQIRKIFRSEMTCLPRKYWNLANNSFLLHGYHNYNHLLLVEKEGHYWLGVPGIYDPREARTAELFGFPQFTDSYNKDLVLSEEERNDFGTFGYWCRYLK